MARGKRKTRSDIMSKSADGKYLKHGAYMLMRKAKDGQLPHGNSKIAQTLVAVEREIAEHFDGLNALQAVQLNLLRPLLVFWLAHPGTVGNGDKLSSDFKWIHKRLEDGLRKLVDLADSKKAARVPSIKEVLAESK